MAASNALACANMALAGYDQVIPLDEVIDTPRGRRPDAARVALHGAGWAVDHANLKGH